MRTLPGLLVRVLLIVPLYFVTMVLVHEAGHAITTTYTTPDSVVRVLVWPGYEVYPNFGFAPNEQWPAGSPAMTLITPVTHDLPGAHDTSFRPILFTQRDLYTLARHLSLIALMGSASTLLVALVSLSLISLLKPKGLMLWLLAAGSLLHLDMLTYTVFPIFLGVRHLVWIGGDVSEPVNALGGLGLPEGYSITAIILLSTLQLVWLYYLLRHKLRRPVQTL